MTKYEVNQKVYVKASNDSHIIISRYTYTLIAFTILSLIINAFIGNEILPTVKNLIASLVFTNTFLWFINIIKKEYQLKKVLIDDKGLVIGFILGIYPNKNLAILLIAITVTIIIKQIIKKSKLSALLLGILIIVVYNTYKLGTYNLTPLIYARNTEYTVSFNELLTYGGGILNYLFGLNYLAPLLSLMIFIYLFYKKSIKYNIVIYYLLTVFLMLLAFCVTKECLWLAFLEFTTNGLCFLTIYVLADYQNSPTIGETGMLYGILIGIVTVILKFIIPNISIIIAMLVGAIFLSRAFDSISYKIKYDKKIYNLSIISSLILMISTTIILIIMN